jgi:hypothetical protein
MLISPITPFYFVEPLERYSKKRALMLMIFAAASGVFGILQTDWYVGLFRGPDPAVIRQEIAKCRARQIDLAARYRNESGKAPFSGIVFEPSLFTENQRRSLQDARHFLLGDSSLQKELLEEFGVSFQDIDALVVPSWEMRNDQNSEKVGLTPDGWRVAKNYFRELNAMGFTIRDSGTELLSYDGRPRIVLTPEAFRSAKTLRLTLFHEFLHAMNVPGYTPSRFSILQNDLTYLPEYRSFIGRTGLEGWRQTAIWSLGVFTPATLFFAACSTLLKLRRRQRQSTDPV